MSNVVRFPSQATILAEIAAIHALAERMRELEKVPLCTLCRPEQKCWFHAPLHSQPVRNVADTI